MSLGAYFIQNKAENKIMIFCLQRGRSKTRPLSGERSDERLPWQGQTDEEYFPLDGDVYIYTGTRFQFFRAIQGPEKDFLDSLKHINLDWNKNLSGNILELHTRGIY